ncbi:unnamed protein product [Taenia asiatica]|uniref:Leucine-rich repeat protein SHOC-2 n=1 Tax=Taenia asiatica TaxID=60517 RepID=A0A158RA38_TAEAS|nr:unnamed protein product [Taenia asiatica]
MTSGTANGSNNSSESVSYAHKIEHDLDHLDMVNVLETASLNSRRKSCLAGSTPHNPKKSKVTVQRPGERKAHRCGPNVKKNKKSGSDCVKAIIQCQDKEDMHLDLAGSQLYALPTSIRVLSAHLCELSLYTNKLVSLPDEIGTLTQLTKLMVQENSLNSLPDSLAECTRLSILDVRHNKLGEIPPVVYRLSNLVLLLLHCNRIRVVDGDIGRLTKLQVLSLGENKIRNLPSIPGVCELKQLTTLDVSKSQLERLPDAQNDSAMPLTKIGLLLSQLLPLGLYFVGRPSLVAALAVGIIHIPSLSVEIGQCRSLTEISVQNNKLTSLPESIGELTRLERLGIKYNHLEALPAPLARCSHHSELNIENNNICQIPAGLLANLKNFTGLSLSRNRFTVFPSGGPQQFVAIQEINMDHNRITKIPFGVFSRASDLVKLNMESNELAVLPPDVKTWTSLVELNLSTNQLTRLPYDIDHLLNLEVLILSDNLLKVCALIHHPISGYACFMYTQPTACTFSSFQRVPPSIQELRKLKVLDLAGNRLDCLPTEIGNLTELQHLILQSNRLTVLPSSIGCLQNLTYLAIGENDLQSLPPAIGELKRLEMLCLDDNFNLHDLPSELVWCCSLQTISTVNCPLSMIPVNVVSAKPSPLIQVGFLKKF